MPLSYSTYSNGLVLSPPDLLFYDMFINLILINIYMNWILSLLFMIIGLVFLFFGYKHKNIEATFIGYAFLFAIGFGILGSGLEIPIGWSVVF